jgi:hypothetical protein
MGSNKKFTRREVYSNSHTINVGLVGNVGYISITDSGLYPDSDSRTERRNLGFNTMMVPLMTRSEMKDLKIAIEEVLRNSK